MKKIITVLCIMVLCITINIPSYSLTTVQSKADLLNEIKVIKGNNSGYNLSGTLTRAEATTFIVRIIGKENLVLDNNKSYVNTGFLDVKPKDWYAPYVGYCVKQGIIDGFNDGTFRPMEAISERAFLKLTAEALGYKKDIDFTWNNLFNFAYKKGIVIDISYKTKTNDNTNYKREEVVNVLYNILDKKIKDEDRSVIKRLVDNKIINANIAEKYGFVMDTNPSIITEINVISSTQIEVIFNEEITDIKEENIIISETTDNAARLNSNIKQLDKDKLILDTDKQENKISYNIMIKDIIDKEGNIKTVDKDFEGYNLVEFESEYFHLSKIVPISKNQIDIYFTQPINAVATIENYYAIKQNGKVIINGSPVNMEIALNPKDKKSISMRLKNHEFDLTKKYELVAKSSLSDRIGAPINNRNNETLEFFPLFKENKKLEFVSATAIDKQTIEIVFNKPLDRVSAEDITNYSVKSPEGHPQPIIKAKLLGEHGGNIVRIGVPLPMRGNTNYPINIKNVKDSLGQYSINDTDSYVYVMDVEHQELTADLVYPLNNREISVYFNQPVDATTAILPSNYLIAGVNDLGFNPIQPVAVYFNEKENNSMVKLMLPVGIKYQNGFKYRLTLNQNIKSATFIPNTSSKDIEFEGIGFDGSKPMINNAKMVTEDTIIVEYNTEIANVAPTTVASNYILRHKEGSNEISQTPSSVTVIDNKYVVLYFSKLNKSTVYTIEANTIQDFSNIGYSVSGEKTQVINYYE